MRETVFRLVLAAWKASFKGRFLGFAKRFVMFQVLKLLPEVLTRIGFLSRWGKSAFQINRLRGKPVTANGRAGFSQTQSLNRSIPTLSRRRNLNDVSVPTK